MRRLASRHRWAPPESVLSGDRPWSLVHGPLEDYLPSLPDDCIDVMITDPPYDEHTHKKGRRGCTGYVEPTRPNATKAQFSRTRDLGFDHMTPELMAFTAQQAARLVKRWTKTYCSLEMISAWKHAFESAGLEYVRTTAWHKLRSTPQMTGDRPAQAIEAMVLVHRPGKKRWNGGGHHGWYPEYEDLPFGVEEFLAEEIETLRETQVIHEPIVQNLKNLRRRFHSTQKPVKLMEKLVALYSNPGEVILDPYAGSFSTGLGALSQGRRVIGFDRDEEAVSWGRYRMQDAGY